MAIGVIGESLVDVVTDANGVSIERPGGSAFNVAIGLARQGVPTQLFTALGNDARGDALLSVLAAEEVVVTRGGSTAATAVAVASIDETGRAAYRFDLAWDPQFGDDWPSLDALHFGSLGSVVAPGAAEVAAIVDRYAGDTLISYDPNWRDGIVDGDAQPIVASNAARAHVVKLSDDDAAAIYPGIELEDVAHALLDLGPSLVIITHAADGASAWTRKAVKHRPATPVEVADTVGAGDAFMSTVLAELGEFSSARIAGLSKRELELVLDFASFVAAKCCGRVGADPPRIADLF